MKNEDTSAGEPPPRAPDLAAALHAAEAERDEARREAASLRAERGPIDIDAIHAAIDALGSSAADVDRRNRGRDALRRLGAGQPLGVVLSGEHERALRGAVELLDMAPDLDAMPEGFRRFAAAARATRRAWIEAGRPLASKEGA